jgi:hypothetical protein
MTYSFFLDSEYLLMLQISNYKNPFSFNKISLSCLQIACQHFRAQKVQERSRRELLAKKKGQLGEKEEEVGQGESNEGRALEENE